MTPAQQRLADVRTAISDILTKGQSISRGDRRLDRAQLASLRALEAEYQAQAAAESQRGRPRQVRLYTAGKGI